MATRLITIITFLWISNAAQSQGKVIANITKLKNDKGVCRCCLFNNPGSFTGDGGKPYQCVNATVKHKASVAIFNNVAPGSYALFIFHDANLNNRIDKNFLGIPKEGYGASRNKLPFASPPKFKDNKFEVENNKTVTLNVEVRNIF